MGDTLDSGPRGGGTAERLLTVLSLLDPDGIPAPLITSTPVLAHLGAAEDQARDALADLLRRSLVTATGDQINVDASTQRAVRDQATPEAITIAARAAADGLVELWPQTEADTDTLRANVAALRAVAEDALWTTDAHAVLFRAGRSLGRAGQATAAVHHFQELTVAAVERLGPDHPDTLDARYLLACWRAESGDAGGAAHEFETLIAEYTRVLGPDHPDTLAARENLDSLRG